MKTPGASCYEGIALHETHSNIASHRRHIAMQITKKYVNDLTYKILGCAIEVHKEMGPGLLEKTYKQCFLIELSLEGLNFKKQKRILTSYKGNEIDTELRYDVLVEDLIVVELKAKESIPPVDFTKLKTYLRLLEKPKGILINFNCNHIFREGQKTIVNEFYALLPDV